MFNTTMLILMLSTWILCGWGSYEANQSGRSADEKLGMVIPALLGIGITIILALVWIVHCVIVNWVP